MLPIHIVVGVADSVERHDGAIPIFRQVLETTEEANIVWKQCPAHSIDVFCLQ